MDDVRVISNYKLIRQIGIGGMGVVYLGQHTVIDRKVAIKLLRPEFSNNEDLVRRFFNEARAAAASSHPGIVEIVDVGFDQGQAFITMEYIEGETLSKYVRSRGRLHPAEAVTFARQVASALQTAHDQSIVHRDLKPSNIMVCHDGKTGLASTKVFDFGIAKLFDENSSHTRTGVVIGTPLYMSPEQCKGAGEVDTRSDLYSLGCILYFMLTGKRVFSGKGDGEIIAQHIFIEPPSPHLLAPVSDSLCGIVLRLLAKEPGDRFQTSADLVAALDAVSEELTEPVSEEPGPSSPPLQHVRARAASVMPLAAPAEPATGRSQGSFPGTGSLVTETPPQIMYPSPNEVPEVVQPPTLMRRLARQGRWLAAGFAILIFIVVGIVSNGPSASSSKADDGEKPSLAREPEANPASESAVVDTKTIDEPTVDEPPKPTEAASLESAKGAADKGAADKGAADKGPADKGSADKGSANRESANNSAVVDDDADTVTIDVPDDVTGHSTGNSSGSRKKKNGRKNDRTNSQNTKQGDQSNTPNSKKPKTFNPFE